MARSRVYYNSLALYASQVSGTAQQTGVGNILEIIRAQTFSDSFQRTLQSILQYGTLAPIDRVDVEPPSVTANFSYYPVDFLNEKRLGFYVTPSGSTQLVTCLSGILTQVTDNKNYYLAIADEGYDEHGYTQSQTGCIGLGNCFINNYEFSASLGQVATSTIGVDAFNVSVYSSVDGTNNVPSIDPANGQPANASFLLPTGAQNQYAGQVSAIQPRDVVLNLAGNWGFEIDTSNLKVSNFQLTIPLAREPINRLGSFFPTSQQIVFPVIATINVDAEFGNLQNFELSDLLCSGESTLSFRFNKPVCGGSGDAAMIIVCSGAKIVSSNTDTAISANGTTTCQWEVAIGGLGDTQHGIFFSGSSPTGLL
jgi:hypothetical protein